VTSPREQLTYTALLFALAVISTIVLLAGCAPMRTLDNWLWSTPSVSKPGDPTAPPPFIETIAGILATCGFGGMALWLRKLSASTNGTLDEHATDLAAINKELSEIRGYLKKEKL
jgi:hypothetical protein